MIILISGVSIFLNYKILESQYKEEGILIASQIGERLSENLKFQENAESILEDKIRVSELTILEMKRINNLSNEFLVSMLEI